MKKTKHAYGWVPDLPDVRDNLYEPLLKLSLKALPFSVDLRKSPMMPPVMNQLTLGSCTAQAIASAFQFAHAPVSFPPSRLFIYYNEREMEGTIQSDSGAYIRDGIKSIASKGVPPESLWPHNISKFKIRPSPAAYAEALNHRALSYYRLSQNLLKHCLAEGHPFVFGFSVYESFETIAVASSGIAVMPKESERLLGGHAVKCVGYNDAVQRFIVKNSWGTKWGMKGYFEMPYAYLLSDDLSADFWVIKKVS